MFGDKMSFMRIYEYVGVRGWESRFSYQKSEDQRSL